MDFWEEVRDFYNHGLFCDLRLVTSDSPEGLRCHQLVMASVSTLLHDILRTHYRHNDENSDLIVNLPDIGKDDLEPILGTVYAKLGAKNCNQDYMCINPDITELLGLCEPIDLKDGHVILDSVKNELPESRVKVEEYNFEGDFQDYYPLSDWANEEEEEDEKPLKRRFQASGTARKRSRAEPTKRRGPRPKKKKLENSRAKELLNLSEEAKALLTPEAQEKLDEAVNETLEEDPEDAEMDKFWGDDAWKRNDDEKLVIKVPKRQKRNPNGKPQKRYKQKKAPKPELCTICGKSFNWTRSLEYHMQYVHGTKEKDMPCHLCDKKFNRKQSLVNHIKGVHVDAKEFQCDQCEKQFSLRK